MSDLAQRVEARLRAEWPGTHMTRDGALFTAPPIRPDGATDTFVKFVARVVAEEASQS